MSIENKLENTVLSTNVDSNLEKFLAMIQCEGRQEKTSQWLQWNWDHAVIQKFWSPHQCCHGLNVWKAEFSHCYESLGFFLLLFFVVVVVNDSFYETEEYKSSVWKPSSSGSKQVSWSVCKSSLYKQLLNQALKLLI